MALANIYKPYRVCNYICSMFVALRKKSMMVDLDAGAVDDFTTQLMQKKADKWEHIKIKRHFPIIAQTNVKLSQIFGDKLQETTTKELNEIFQTFLDEDEPHSLFVLLNECIEYRKTPSDLILSNTLRYCAHMASIEGIKKVQELCSLTNPDYLEANSDFKHYIAEITWVKGNISKAIEMFEEVYHKNHFLRRRIRLILKNLISEAVTNRSEAILVNLVKFTENLLKKYKDYYLLTCLWQVCFLSEWYSDQKVALDLLKQNDGLCKMLVNQIPYVVCVSLKHNKTDPVYRLLEILLKYEMKMQYSIVLVALFDYRYRQGDLQSCSEILRWSVKYNIMLPSIQHEKFLKLLMNHDSVIKKRRPSKHDYELKF